MVEFFTSWGLILMTNVLKPLPESIRLKIVGGLGFFYGLFPHKQKKAVMKNYHHLLNLNHVEQKMVSRKIFRNFAYVLHDFFLPHGVHITTPPLDLFQKLQGDKKGIMVLTFHMGNWELGAVKLRELGWPVTAVYQPYRNQRFKNLIQSRRAAGVHFIPVGQDAAKGVGKALRNGRMVAMLGDQTYGEKGVPVQLLGRRVMWPQGPILLAVKELAPIVVGVVIQTGLRKYTTIFSDPLIPQKKTLSEVSRITQEVAHKFGMLLTQYPDQWYRLNPLEFVGKEKFKDQNPSSPNVLIGDPEFQERLDSR